MPVLKDFRQTKVVELPSFPDSKIEIYDSVLVGNMMGIDFRSEDQLKQVIQSLPKFIKSWNFTDEDGKDLEITPENVGVLKMDDVQFLGQQIMEFAAEVKKNKSSSQD